MTKSGVVDPRCFAGDHDFPSDSSVEDLPAYAINCHRCGITLSAAACKLVEELWDIVNKRIQ